MAVAQPGQPVSNKAIELQFTDLSTAPAIGNRKAADGREFVVVTTSWKSLVPPQKVNRKKVQDRTAGMGSLGFGGGATAKDKADDEANTTLEDVPFEIGPLTQKVWLIANGARKALTSRPPMPPRGISRRKRFGSRRRTRCSRARSSFRRRPMPRRWRCSCWIR